jgi:hypothetical protein
MKLIRKLLLFSLITIVTYVLLVFAMCKIPFQGKPLIYITNDYFVWKGGDSYAKFREFKQEEDSLDIIFLGSSRGYRHYDPAFFAQHGISSFNLGSQAQSIKNSYHIFKNCIIPKKPKVVVLDIYYNVFATDGFESSTDLIMNVVSDDLASDILKSAPDARLLNSYMLRTFTKGSGPSYEDEHYKSRGYSNKSDTLDNEFIERILRDSTRFVPTLDEQWRYLRKIYSLAGQHGIQIETCVSPATPSYNTIQKEDFAKKFQEATQVFKRQTNYWDFSDLEGIKWKEHFYDDSHMNLAGVEIFNEALLEKLRDHLK